MHRIFSILLLISLSAHASNFSFFESDINYWPENKEEPGIVKKSKVSEGNFDWNKASDPRNDEFYRVGDHMPPAALVEAMKNPTDKNLERYYALEDKRNKKLQSFVERSQKFRLKSLDQSFVELKKEAPSQNTFYNSRELRQKYKFRMYYDFNCPHCQRMYGVFKKLKHEGFTIDSVQIDDSKKSFIEINTRKIRRGEGHTVGLFNGGTPYTLIVNNETKKITSFRGFASYAKLMSALN